MKKIYTASREENISLKLSNDIGCFSTVKINDIVVDEIELANEKGNFRVIELELNSGDEIIVTDDNKITHEIINTINDF